MKKFTAVVLLAAFVALIGCGGNDDDVPPQSIKLSVASMDSTSVKIGVELNRHGWFNLALADASNPIAITSVSSPDATVSFIDLLPQTAYEAHGMTFDVNGEQTSDDWLRFTTPAAPNP